MNEKLQAYVFIDIIEKEILLELFIFTKYFRQISNKMAYKTILQSIIIFFIFLAIFLFLSKYFKNNRSQELESKIENSKESLSIKKKSNIINDVTYSTVDIKGNKYEIYSKTGEVDLNNPNLIFMKDVKAKIILQNNEVIFIISDFAKYNNLNYETNFSKNIKLSYIEHIINCENIYLNVENNFLTMYEDLIYLGKHGKVNADRVEIDLLTKDMKIMMDDDKENITIKVNKT